MRYLGPRGEAASPSRPLSRAWPVLRETLKYDAGAADMFVLQVAERAAADDLGDRFERRLRGQPLRQIGNGRNPPDLRLAEIILTGAYRQYSGFTNAAPMPVTARRPCGLGRLLIRLFLSGLV